MIKMIKKVIRWAYFKYVHPADLQGQRDSQKEFLGYLRERENLETGRCSWDGLDQQTLAKLRVGEPGLEGRWHAYNEGRL